MIEYSGPTHDPAFLYPDIDKAERDAALEANTSWLAPNHYVPHMDRLIVTIQLWVLHAGGNVIVIDTGVGNRKPRPHERMDRLNTLALPWLEAAGAAPDKVTHVVMTHLHTDHVGWNTVARDGQWVPTFPNARYLFPARGIRLLEGRIRQGRQDVQAGSFADSVLPIARCGAGRLHRRREGSGGLPHARAGAGPCARHDLVPSALARRGRPFHRAT